MLMQYLDAFLFVIFIFNLFWVIWFFWVKAVLNDQARINEALANYVAADLKQTWQKSAEELVTAIRGKPLDAPPKS